MSGVPTVPPINLPASIANPEGRLTSGDSVQPESSSSLSARIRKLKVLPGLPPRRDNRVLFAGDTATVNQSCPSGRTCSSYPVSSSQLSLQATSIEVEARKGVATLTSVGSSPARRKPAMIKVVAMTLRIENTRVTGPSKCEAGSYGNTGLLINRLISVNFG